MERIFPARRMAWLQRLWCWRVTGGCSAKAGCPRCRWQLSHRAHTGLFVPRPSQKNPLLSSHIPALESISHSRASLPPSSVSEAWGETEHICLGDRQRQIFRLLPCPSSMHLQVVWPRISLPLTPPFLPHSPSPYSSSPLICSYIRPSQLV